MAVFIDFGMLQALFEAIDAGDENALLTAQGLSKKIAKTANVRLRALEQEGLVASPAYQRATFFTKDERNALRFSESKKLSGDALKDQLRELEIFMNSPSSLVSEEKARQSGLNKFMPNATKQEKQQMLRFLASGAFEEMKKFQYAGDLINKASDAIENGHRVSDLQQLYTEYLQREAAGELGKDEDIITEVWSKWI